jgi:hypothetical protein
MQTTWVSRTLTAPWALPGAASPTDDIITPAATGQTVFPVWSYPPGRYPFTWDVTSLVQSWVSDAAHNYGLLLRGDGETSVEYHFYSGDDRDDRYWPVLWVAYEPSGAPTLTPTPTATTGASATPTVGSSPTPTSTPAVSATPTASPTSVASPTAVHNVYSAVADTYLDQLAPTTARGLDRDYLWFQKNLYTPLVRFDLSQVPNGSYVRSAKLRLCNSPAWVVTMSQVLSSPAFSRLFSSRTSTFGGLTSRVTSARYIGVVMRAMRMPKASPRPAAAAISQRCSWRMRMIAEKSRDWRLS